MIPEIIPTDRRDWLRRVIRYGALGGIAALTACLVRRHPRQACSGSSLVCETCQLLPGCELPPAASVRTIHRARGNA